MSMEMFVLSDRELNSIGEWQSAISTEGYPLQLDPSVQLGTHSGFLPAHLRGNLTGFECDHFPADEYISENSDIAFEHDWKFVLGFRWLGSRDDEMLAAWMAATAYAHATGGSIFDAEDEEMCTAAQGREVVHKLEHPSPAYEAVVREMKRGSD